MPMMTPGFSEQEVRKAAERRELLKDGWYSARISEAIEKVDKNKKIIITLTCLVHTGQGDDRTIFVNLTGYDRGAILLRHTCESVGLIERYNNSEAISAADFPGHDVRVHITTEKKQRGQPERNIVDDIASGVAQ